MAKRSVGLRPAAVILVALSLSIGWGIRGNFGHNEGAMIPGALAGIAVCLVAGRDDWRNRVAYFGMFGAIGWWFGGSISYMQVVSYTHSGHAPSQLYGFAALWLIGFLWGCFGGAFTAMPATFDREHLTALFKPLSLILAVWCVWAYAESPVVQWYRERVWGEDPGAFNASGHRQESPFYWFDTDWVLACLALGSMWTYDLVSGVVRKQRRVLPAPVFGIVGAILGGLVYTAAVRSGAAPRIVDALVVYQGDLTKFAPEQLLTNWPQFLWDYPSILGWGLGLVVGLTVYFVFFGEFRSGSSLFVHMAAGWLIVFLALPVLLSTRVMDWGGFRLTPPRGDDWAGMLGAYVGLLLYAWRKRLAPVAYASVVSGVVGGIGFSSMVCLKLIMVWPGNPWRLNPSRISPSPTADIETAWAHWQNANWHSFLEQTYGFVNGLGIALALGLLAIKAPPLTDTPGRRVRPWTLVYAVAFVLLFVLYVNLFKNVAVWTREGYKPVPATMLAPLFRISLSAETWFNLTFAAMAIVVIALLALHLKRPLPLIPPTGLGKGQWFYLVFLWAIVVGNFERALTGFHEQRLLTEWVIILNALICTVLILTLPRESDRVTVSEAVRWKAGIARATAIGALASFAFVVANFGVVRMAYDNAYAGHAGRDGKGQMRFGPEAEWRVRPNLRQGEHQ